MAELDPNLRFNDFLSHSIDETISELLGAKLFAALHEHLISFYDVRPEQVVNRLDVLDRVLEKNFGRSSKVVERAIAKRFYLHLNLPFPDRPSYGLADYVEEAKNSFSVSTET